MSQSRLQSLLLVVKCLLSYRIVSTIDALIPCIYSTRYIYSISAVTKCMCTCISIWVIYVTSFWIHAIELYLSRHNNLFRFVVKMHKTSNSKYRAIKQRGIGDLTLNFKANIDIAGAISTFVRDQEFCYILCSPWGSATCSA